MKKLLLAMIIGLMMTDSHAVEIAFERPSSSGEKASLSIDLDDFAQARRKSKRRRSKSRGRGAEMGLVISPNLGLALPIGDLGESLKIGFGGGIDASYAVMPSLLVGVNTGYYSFGFKELSEGGFEISGNQSYLPVLVQGSYLFDMDFVKPYAGLGLGLFFGTSYLETGMEVKIGNHPTNGAPVYETLYQKTLDNSAEFGVSPFAGVFYAVNNNIHLNAGLRMNAIFSTTTEIQEDFTVVESSKTLTYLTINMGVAICLGN